MTYEDAQRHSGLAARLARDLARAGHQAKVEITDCEGFALCRIDGLELEPEQIPTLCRALRLIGYSNTKLFRALGALQEFAR